MALIRSAGIILTCLIVTVISAQQPTPETSATAPIAEKAPADTLSEISLTELQQRADAGDGKAQSELAYRYRFGSGGVEKDKAKSVEWLHRAAASGIALAYFNLGAAYYNGDGVEINDDQSCKWFVLANDAGSNTRRKQLNEPRQRFPRDDFTIVNCWSQMRT